MPVTYQHLKNPKQLTCIQLVKTEKAQYVIWCINTRYLFPSTGNMSYSYFDLFCLTSLDYQFFLPFFLSFFCSTIQDSCILVLNIGKSLLSSYPLKNTHILHLVLPPSILLKAYFPSFLFLSWRIFFSFLNRLRELPNTIEGTFPYFSL